MPRNHANERKWTWNLLGSRGSKRNLNNLWICHLIHANTTPFTNLSVTNAWRAKIQNAKNLTLLHHDLQFFVLMIWSCHSFFLFLAAISFEHFLRFVVLLSAFSSCPKRIQKLLGRKPPFKGRIKTTNYLRYSNQLWGTIISNDIAPRPLNIYNLL